MILNINKLITCSVCEQHKREDYYTLAQTLSKRPICEPCQDELTAGATACKDESLTAQQWAAASPAFKVGYEEEWSEGYYSMYSNRYDPADFYRDEEWEQHLNELPNESRLVLATEDFIGTAYGIIALAAVVVIAEVLR